MHEQEVAGIVLCADLLRNTRRHGNSGDAGRADQRVDLAAGDNAHSLAEQAACSSTERESDKTESDDLEGRDIQECLRAGGSTDGSTQKDNDDVHQSVGSSVGQLADNAALTEEVAQHEHTDKGSRRGKDHTHDNCNNDGEKDPLELGDRSELRHPDLALLVCGQRAHDGRLNDRDKGHIGVGGDSDGSEKFCLSQLGAEEDRGRAVGTADDGDRGRGFAVEAQSDRAEVCAEDTELRGSAEQEAHGIGDQGTEVRHGADAHEDQ